MIRPNALFAPQPAATLDEPLTHLMACHRRIEDRLDTLDRAAAHLEDRGDEALNAIHACFRFLDSNGVLHTADEEESLFPRLKPKMEPGERTYLAGLEHDHTEAHLMYTALKALIATPEETAAWRAQVRGLVSRLTAHYRRHISNEDDSLQSYGRNLLTSEELAAISAEMKSRRGL